MARGNQIEKARASPVSFASIPRQEFHRPTTVVRRMPIPMMLITQSMALPTMAVSGFRAATVPSVRMIVTMGWRASSNQIEKVCRFRRNCMRAATLSVESAARRKKWSSLGAFKAENTVGNE